MYEVMASLQGLPPLPRSLRALLNAGSAQWKEMERIHQMKTSIEHDIEGSESDVEGGGGSGSAETVKTSDANGELLWPGAISNANGYTYGRKSSGSSDGNRKNSVHKPPPPGNLESTIAYLRKEMVSLRQLDMSLLCQLWGLNESIQEFKHATHNFDTISECSSYSLENGLDTIGLSTTEEHEYENEMFHNHNYENLDATEDANVNGIRNMESVPNSQPHNLQQEEVYEPVYLEPTPCKASRRNPLQKVTSSFHSNCPSPAWTRQCACNTTYESNC